MASKNNNLPSWLTDVKEDAIKTNEWNELSKHIYEAVDQHLSQSHVPYFTDLTEDEKSLLLERAAKSLASSDGGRVYENLQSKLSYILDQTVNNQVAKKMLEDSALDTKTDLVLDTASEGIVTLLRKHPEQKYKLKVFLNQSIPQPIRFLAWQLYFANQIHRKNFLNKLDTNPKLCLSPQDAEIQRRCESILNSAVTFRELKDSKGNSNSLKGVLSYYHTTLNSKRSLTESEFLFAMPIINSHYPPFPKNDSPTERSMAILIEIYLQFINTLPSAIVQSTQGIEDNAEMDLLVRRVVSLLDQHDRQLLKFIKDLANKNSPSGIEDITFFTTIRSFCIPLIKNLYSGYLSLNPLMFVWDQYVIGMDVPEYHNELIPVITAIIFMILRDQLMSVRSEADFDDCLKTQSNFIQTRQIQTILNKYFFKSLQSKLNNSNRVGPIIDPTIGRLQPWEHWHQDIIPRRTMRIREPDESDEKLRAEINRRILAEKAARDEIDRLRRELDDLRNKPRSPGPVSPKITPKPEPAKEILPASLNPVIDVLNRLKQSVLKVGNGENENRKALDTQTSQDLKLHKLDLKIAEKEVFGHQLAPYEWESLSEREKKVKSEQMLAIVKKRLEKRFNETGKF